MIKNKFFKLNMTQNDEKVGEKHVLSLTLAIECIFQKLKKKKKKKKFYGFLNI